MTDNDILRFAMMPKYNHVHALQVQSEEAITPMVDMINEVNEAFDQISLFNTAYSKISRHGVTDFIKKEYADTLSPYSINFETQPVSACLEGLSSMVERLWTVIKNLVTRLYNYFMTHTYFGAIFEKCEYYQRRMSELIAGPLKGYLKADLNLFNSVMVSGMAYDVFVQNINYVGMLISKLKSITPYSLGGIDVSITMTDVTRHLNIPYEDGRYSIVSTPAVERKSLYDLCWTPFKVNSVASSLYSKIAVNAIGLNRLRNELARSLAVALKECEDVLNGKIDGDDNTRIQHAKLRVLNIRNIQVLTAIAMKYLCTMCGQWCRMASLFDTGERPYPA